MAWTAPRTWVVGEVVTAAQMNTHIRDNELYLKALAHISTGHAHAGGEDDGKTIFAQGARRIEYKEGSWSIPHDSAANQSITWDNAFTSIIGVFVTVFNTDWLDNETDYLDARSTTGATAWIYQASGVAKTITISFLGIGT